MYSFAPERRSKRRVRVNFPVLISGTTVPEARGITRDASQTGVFFYTQLPLKSGQVVEFKMLMPAADASSTRAVCRGTIVRVETQSQASEFPCGVAVAITSLKLSE